MDHDTDLRLLNILAGAPVGGAETFFVTMTKAFQAAGLEQRAVIRANPDRAAQLRTANVEVDEARFGSLFDVRTELKLDKIVREFRPSVVLSYMERASSFMPKGSHLKLARLGGYYKLKYFRRCDHLLCITNDIRRHVIAEGWPEDRAHYMPNFAETTDTPAIDRAELDTPEGVPVIFTPGRLHKVKGLDTLITSMKAVPEAYLWIAGDGPEREALIAHAADEGVSDRVRFLGWRTETGPFFRACDIVAFPSRHEPFGTVTLEAWAYAKPLVVTDAQGPVEVVRPDQDGVMVPKNDPAALAAGFKRVLGNPDFARTLVEHGTARHQADFTEAACVARYLDLFRALS
jgi:glycosyltransferase involved in cell wall biosynthesis